MTAYVTVDVETAGFTPANGMLLEVALAFVADGKVLGSAERLIKPTGKWQYNPVFQQSQKIHGITAAEILRDGMPVEQAAGEIHGLLSRFADKHGPPVFVAHKMDFEARWLTDAPWGFDFELDTLDLAREKLPGLDSHKLGVVVDHLGIEWTGPAHRARPDAVACAEVLLRLQQVPVAAPVLLEPAPIPELPAESDLYDVRNLLSTYAPQLAAHLRRQLELNDDGFGEEADDLLPATLAGLRALLLRAGTHDERTHRLLMECAAAIPFARKHRRPVKPDLAVLRLWGDEPLTPIGPATVGAACIPGAVYRRPTGDLVALSRDEIAKLEVTHDDR